MEALAITAALVFALLMAVAAWKLSRSRGASVDLEFDEQPEVIDLIQRAEAAIAPRTIVTKHVISESEEDGKVDVAHCTITNELREFERAWLAHFIRTKGREPTKAEKRAMRRGGRGKPTPVKVG